MTSSALTPTHGISPSVAIQTAGFGPLVPCGTLAFKVRDAPANGARRSSVGRSTSGILTSVGGVAGNPVRGDTHWRVGRPVAASVGQYVS